MEIGSRVLNTHSGCIGYVEGIEDIEGHTIVDYRTLTPKNKPSCCVAFTGIEDLIEVDENVVPMARSKEFYRNANEFLSSFIGDIMS